MPPSSHNPQPGTDEYLLNELSKFWSLMGEKEFWEDSKKYTTALRALLYVVSITNMSNETKHLMDACCAEYLARWEIVLSLRKKYNERKKYD